MADMSEESPALPRQSRQPSNSSFVKQRPRISIVDHTQPPDEPASSRPGSPDVGPSTPRGKKTTSGKFARFTEQRAASGDDGPGPSMSDSKYGKNPFHRGRAQLHDKLHGLRQKSQQVDQDSEIDVLYENQRGTFLWGMPFFSSRALNPLDHAPWVDRSFNRSRENITNAQVPDPSWEWAWRAWYVDMSRDVDEEGWEYSFYFKGCSWHGVHPWFHSFVRRRRWIRKRVRKPSKPTGDPHNLAQDYFTIHSGKGRSIFSGATSPTNEAKPKITLKQWGKEDKEPWEEQDIQNMASLLQALKHAPVDSERIVLIRTFIKKGGDDLYYLADEIPKIMSFFFHEHSCRRLLAVLTSKVEEANANREEHEQTGELEDDDEKRYIEALLKAADVVDQQCKKLEFWSDLRGLTREGKMITAVGGDGWSHEFTGLDQSGPENSRAPSKTEQHDSADNESESSNKSDTTYGKGKQVLRPEGYSIDSSVVTNPMDTLDASFSQANDSQSLVSSSIQRGPSAASLDADEDTETSTLQSAKSIQPSRESKQSEQQSESQYDTPASITDTRKETSHDQESSEGNHSTST